MFGQPCLALFAGKLCCLDGKLVNKVLQFRVIHPLELPAYHLRRLSSGQALPGRGVVSLVHLSGYSTPLGGDPKPATTQGNLEIRSSSGIVGVYARPSVAGH